MAVGKLYLKAYNFATMEDYFDYILLSKINGQQTQVLNLIDKMSKQQKKNCLTWFSEQKQTNDVLYCKQMLIKAI